MDIIAPVLSGTRRTRTMTESEYEKDPHCAPAHGSWQPAIQTGRCRQPPQHSRTSLGNFHSANAFLYVDDEGKEEEEED